MARTKRNPRPAAGRAAAARATATARATAAATAAAAAARPAPFTIRKPIIRHQAQPPQNPKWGARAPLLRKPTGKDGKVAKHSGSCEYQRSVIVGNANW